jgi:uncharacterized protein YraI
LAFPENGGLFVNSASLHLKRASLQEVKTMQEKERKEIKNEGNKENGGIQVIFFEAKRNYEAEMKKWERLYNDTDGWLDKDYLVVRKIDERNFR